MTKCSTQFLPGHLIGIMTRSQFADLPSRPFAQEFFAGTSHEVGSHDSLIFFCWASIPTPARPEKWWTSSIKGWWDSQYMEFHNLNVPSHPNIRQLGWWFFPILMGKCQIDGNQTTNQFSMAGRWGHEEILWGWRERPFACCGLEQPRRYGTSLAPMYHYLVVHPTNRKWAITPVISGLNPLIPFITRVVTHLLSGMNHQVVFS